MANPFWVDEDGNYYYINSTTQLIREDGFNLFKITPSAPVVPGIGEPMGLLLTLTYPA